jgi:hypothetical protein
LCKNQVFPHCDKLPSNNKKKKKKKKLEMGHRSSRKQQLVVVLSCKYICNLVSFDECMKDVSRRFVTSVYKQRSIAEAARKPEPTPQQSR